jgi:hypothetical protein
VSLLASADAALVMVDHDGLTLAEAGVACAETTRVLIEDLTTQATAPPPKSSRIQRRST